MHQLATFQTLTTTVSFRNDGAVPSHRSRLWILRLLVPLKGYSLVLSGHEELDAELARSLDLDRDLQRSRELPEGERTSVLGRLEALWREAERGPPEAEPDLVADNTALVAAALGLSVAEHELLSFCVAMAREPMLRAASQMQGPVSLVQLERILALCLGLPEAEVREALHSSGVLIQTGLLRLDWSGTFTVPDRIELMSGLCEQLDCRHQDALEIFADRVVRSGPARLEIADYPHLAADAAILQPYLGEALSETRPGRNLLIHGRPGTGKTEWVRALAQAVGGTLYEVPAAPGCSGTGARLRAYCLAQALLARKPGALLLFDEIEDAFTGDRWQGEGHGRFMGKAFVNSILEDNAVPAFWVANTLRGVDPAHLRRFEGVWEMKSPPRSVRRKILDKRLLGLSVSDAWKERMAEQEHLVPAVVEHAAALLGSARALSGPALERGLERLMGQTLAVLGVSESGWQVPRVAPGYRPELLNADADLAQLVRGLQSSGAGRICLYGAPGTGKSTFAEYVARMLDRPLMTRSASELLGALLGATEQNLAAMFAAARAEGAVLLLDEADSFLQDRGQARQRWEISQVNELLVQMERFEGVFIATTNRMEALDAAALRRFDLKLCLLGLRPEQAQVLFRDTLVACGVAEGHAAPPRLAALSGLTLGDFGMALRQARLHPVVDAADLLARLVAERALRGETSRPMGFTAS